MGHKLRGYSREIPVELERDYKLFAIACEGSRREPEYFKVFQHISRKIKVDLIEDVVSDAEMQVKHQQKSAPQWVLDRAVKYIDKEGLLDEDDLWFVMDIDRWTEEQIRTIAHYCETYPNWHIVLSNPCFEVWLYFHKKATMATSTSNSCNDFKHEISTLEKGGYHPLKFIADLPQAIINSKRADSNEGHFLPGLKETKVYLLGEAIMEIIGRNDFDEFLRVALPKLAKPKVVKKQSLKKPKKK